MDVINLKSDLVAIIRAQMYEACARGFVVDQGANHLDNPEHVHRLISNSFYQNVKFVTRILW
jgi:hypothetical protein